VTCWNAHLATVQGLVWWWVAEGHVVLHTVARLSLAGVKRGICICITLHCIPRNYLRGSRVIESANCQARDVYLISLVLPQLPVASNHPLPVPLVLMEVVDDLGKTSTVYRVREGLVWKTQRKAPSEFWSKEIAHSFKVEHALLQRLGNHPGIVRYVLLFTAV
jgi:hypothetical protein